MEATLLQAGPSTAASSDSITQASPSTKKTAAGFAQALEQAVDESTGTAANGGDSPLNEISKPTKGKSEKPEQSDKQLERALACLAAIQVLPAVVAPATNPSAGAPSGTESVATVDLEMAKASPVVEVTASEKMDSVPSATTPNELLTKEASTPPPVPDPVDVEGADQARLTPPQPSPEVSLTSEITTGAGSAVSAGPAARSDKSPPTQGEAKPGADKTRGTTDDASSVSQRTSGDPEPNGNCAEPERGIPLASLSAAAAPSAVSAASEVWNATIAATSEIEPTAALAGSKEGEAKQQADRPARASDEIAHAISADPGKPQCPAATDEAAQTPTQPVLTKEGKNAGSNERPQASHNSQASLRRESTEKREAAVLGQASEIPNTSVAAVAPERMEATATVHPAVTATAIVTDNSVPLKREAAIAGELNSAPTAPQATASDTALKSAPHPDLGPVQVARMAERAGQSEMHIGLRTSSFGMVDVHTTVRENLVGFAVGSERGDLRSFLAPEVPAMQTILGQHELRLEEIRFFSPAAQQSNMFSPGGGTYSQPQSQQQYGARPQTLVSQGGQNDTREIEEPLVSNSGLNVHA